MNDMNRALLGVAVGVVVAAVIGLALYLGNPAGNIPASVSDIAVGETVAYRDFHTCRLPDGETAYDVHFGGVDRSRRAQLVYRHDNIGRRTLRVVTNDPSLPKSHVRLVVETRQARDLEGHNFGTAWSAEVLQINPRRPIRSANPILLCGPERR